MIFFLLNRFIFFWKRASKIEVSYFDIVSYLHVDILTKDTETINFYTIRFETSFSEQGLNRARRKLWTRQPAWIWKNKIKESIINNRVFGTRSATLFLTRKPAWKNPVPCRALG